MTWLEASFRHDAGDFELSMDFSMEREIAAFFGPSGSGKIMTLRLMAGLIRPNRSGTLRIGESILQEATRWTPPQTRGIAMVFQDLALFPHMTATENVAFAMDHRIGASQASRRALEWLDRVNLADKASLRPDQLSGGQRQRVALARALSSEPDLLLLDEPFSALDTPLRRSLRREMKRLHRETGVPMIYVSHQIEDVCALGDRIVLVRDGSVSGQLRSDELGTNAAHRWHSLGWGTMIGGTVVRGHGAIRFLWSGGSMLLPPGVDGEGPASAFIPPDGIVLVYPGQPVDPSLTDNQVRGTVLERFVMGHRQHLHVQVGETIWEVEHPLTSYDSMDIQEGRPVTLSVRPRHISVLFQERRTLP